MIESGGMWLGVLDDIEEFTKEAELMPEPGDTVFLFTDGVTEYQDSTTEMFGLERLTAFMDAHGHLSPDDIINRL